MGACRAEAVVVVAVVMIVAMLVIVIVVVMMVVRVIMIMAMIAVMMVVVAVAVLMALHPGVTLSASAYRAHGPVSCRSSRGAQSTSSSLIRISSPPVTCSW